jgi:hypothetical protein
MDGCVCSLHSLCAASAVGINIGGGAHPEREGTIKIKRYGKWNGKFNSVQQRCCVPLAFLSAAHDLIFHQRHKTRRTRRGSSRQEIKVPTTTTSDD